MFILEIGYLVKVLVGWPIGRFDLVVVYRRLVSILILGSAYRFGYFVAWLFLPIEVNRIFWREREKKQTIRVYREEDRHVTQCFLSLILSIPGFH